MKTDFPLEVRRNDGKWITFSTYKVRAVADRIADRLRLATGHARPDHRTQTLSLARRARGRALSR